MSQTKTHQVNSGPATQALGRQGPFSAKQVVSILQELIQQVGTLHAAGTIHRAIGPDTVQVNSDGTLRLANSLESMSGDLSACDSMPADLEGVSVATLPIRIDEAAAALKKLGHHVDPRRVDLYQLGVLGCKLFTGKALSAYLRSPRVKAQVPVPLQAFVDSALGFDPDRRYSDCESLAEALAQIDWDADVAVRDDAAKLDSEETDPAVDDSLLHDFYGSDDTPLPGSPDPLGPPTPRFGEVVDRGLPPGPPAAGESPVAADGSPFETLGPYKIVRRLGRGGMGDVYQAYDQTLDRHVAIKVLPPELARHEAFVQRFQVEAAAAAKVCHPNVVQVFCTGEDAGHQFFVMQLIVGESLAQLLTRHQRLDVNEAILIVTQCLEGLRAAHAAGLVHRDVKPGNILLERATGRAILADFGLVKVHMHESPASSAGTIMGTFDYLSPEQAQGKCLDGRADLYSLGVVLYQMLSGRLPFDAKSSTGLMFQHVFQTPTPLTEVAPHIPAELSWIVDKLLAKERDDRYLSAAEALADLKRFQVETPQGDDLGASSDRAPGSRRVRAGSGTKEGRNPPRQRNRTVIWAACALPVLGLLGLVMRADKNRDLQSIPKGESENSQPTAISQAVDKNKPLEKEVINSIGMKLMLIQPGEFLMGSLESDVTAMLSERPQHAVQLTKPFYMGAYEVTRGQFKQFYEATDQATRDNIDLKSAHGYDPSRRGIMDRGPEFSWQNVGWEQSDNHPVINVSYNTAVAFCHWLSIKESKQYRLPTEAEWEYCCRAGSTSRFYRGDLEEDIAEFENTFDASTVGFLDAPTTNPWMDGFPFTAPVGSFRSNAFGLYDMLGNVREFCSDNFMSNYGTRAKSFDPTGPIRGYPRVTRGGSWMQYTVNSRSASRSQGGAPTSRFHDLGFRVVQQEGMLLQKEPPPVIETADPDRQAAIWALKSRGSIQVRSFDERGDLASKNVLCTELNQLPIAGFQLRAIDLSFKQKLSDSDLGVLRGLVHLERLDLKGSRVSDGGFDCLEGLSHLQELDLRGTQATDELIQQLIPLKNLKVLNLADTFVTDEGMLCLHLSSALERLDFANTPTRGAFLRGFKDPSHIQSLILDGTEITSENLIGLKKFSGLTFLSLAKTDVSDRGLNFLVGLPSLESLDLTKTKVTAAGIEQLKSFKKLKTLRLSHENFSEDLTKSLQAALPDCLLKN